MVVIKSTGTEKKGGFMAEPPKTALIYGMYKGI